jgi:hypothetical protein
MPGRVPGIHVFLGCGQDVDGRDIGERSDAVLRTAIPGHDDQRSSYFRLKHSLRNWAQVSPLVLPSCFIFCHSAPQSRSFCCCGVSGLGSAVCAVPGDEAKIPTHAIANTMAMMCFRIFNPPMPRDVVYTLIRINPPALPDPA